MAGRKSLRNEWEATGIWAAKNQSRTVSGFGLLEHELKKHRQVPLRQIIAA